MPRAVLGLLAAIALASCHDETTPMASAPAVGLRWIRDQPLALPDTTGSMGPVRMHTDAGGGTWVALPLAEKDRSRLLYRAPEGGWTTLLEGPPMTEVSLGSVRGGEAYLGYNLPLEGYSPRLLGVRADGGTTTLPVPVERNEAQELLQVGAFAMVTDDDGWACGQRGRLWRYHAGQWASAPPVFPWKPGDRVNQGYCSALQLEAPDLGWAAGLDKDGARWNGLGWTVLPDAGVAGSIRVITPASGLGVRDHRLFRFDGASWVPLGETEIRVSAIFDEHGKWGCDGIDTLQIRDTDVVKLTGAPREAVYAVGTIDGGPAVVASDGVYRSTTRDVPTFRAAPDALPSPLRGSIAADVDQDGDDDLMGWTPDGELAVLLGNGDGRFTAVTDAWQRGDHPRVGWFDLGDLDGDALLDVVGVDGTAWGDLRVWRGLGKGRFARSVVLPRADRPVATVILADIDGDGDLDVTAGGYNALVLLNDGAGGFRRGPPMRLPPGSERLAWADADGDGDLDAVVTRWRDPGRMFRNDGDHFTEIELPIVLEGTVIADLDHDGTPELYAQIVHDRGVLRPFVKCVLSATGCASVTETGVPSGKLLDLNLDGVDDVVSTNLRGDALVPVDGTVHLASTKGYTSIDEVTGRLPGAVGLDANGDGALDVVTDDRGMLLGTSPKGTMLRVRPRASTSNRLANGAQVIVRRAGSDRIVASVQSAHGDAIVGLPDATARYDVEVRFPGGISRVVRGVAASSDVMVRDAHGAAFAARLARLFLVNAVHLAVPVRDGALFLAGLAVVLLVASRRSLLPLRRRALSLYAISFAILVGVAVSARGLWPWLASPASMGVSAGLTALSAFVSRRRSERHVGPYTLIERLGAGAAATVWRARQGSRSVALKVFAADSMLRSDARDRFFREARAGSEIAHDNVVRILDSGHLEDGRCYLAMQLVEGQSLDRWLDGKPVAPARTRRLALDVAEALVALHAAGIIHRDVKPGNIMIRTDGRAVVTDLGLVRSALFRTVTRHDVAVGTLSYMSPEQCIGSAVDGRSDLWSLGVVLYEMLEGRRPFEADHELELVYRIHNVPPRPLGARVPEDLRMIVARCLTRDPAARFPGARELVTALVEADVAGSVVRDDRSMKS